jgi:flavin-dependent dehydrogenase
MNRDFDVLVLGAGPAGAATAIDLARRGFHVALADRKAFPRAKPCGEFLSPECLPYLAELGEGDLLARLGASRVAGMRLSAASAVAHGAFRSVGDKPHARAGFGIRRERFDLALVEAAARAGATFLPRHEFLRLQRDADGVVVGAVLRDPDGAARTIACKHVVGADGVHSRVARDLGVQRPVPWLQQFALTTHFRGVAPRAQAAVHLFPSGFFAATTVDDGCFSVNVVLPKAELRAMATHDHDALLRQKLADAPDLLAALAGAERTSPWRGIGPFAHDVTAPTGPGWLLVGDAAGYCDPLTGEGIYFALYGARHAAAALADALEQPGDAAASLRGYEAARRRELAPRLRASRWLQSGLQRPWMLRTAVRSLARWPSLADLVVTMSGDTIHPRDLLRPSFWRAFRASA